MTRPNPHYVRWMVAGREPAPFPPDHPVWTPPPGTPGPGQVFPGSQQRCAPLPARQCIACGAQVPAGRSEACPHD